METYKKDLEEKRLELQTKKKMRRDKKEEENRIANKEEQ